MRRTPATAAAVSAVSSSAPPPPSAASASPSSSGLSSCRGGKPPARRTWCCSLRCCSPGNLPLPPLTGFRVLPPPSTRYLGSSSSFPMPPMPRWRSTGTATETETVTTETGTIETATETATTATVEMRKRKRPSTATARIPGGRFRCDRILRRCRPRPPPRRPSVADPLLFRPSSSLTPTFLLLGRLLFLRKRCCCPSTPTACWRCSCWYPFGHCS